MRTGHWAVVIVLLGVGTALVLQLLDPEPNGIVPATPDVTAGAVGGAQLTGRGAADVPVGEALDHQVSGRVVDRGGQPVAGVAIRVLAGGGWIDPTQGPYPEQWEDWSKLPPRVGPTPRVISEIVSDAEGRFVAPALPDEVLWVEARPTPPLVGSRRIIHTRRRAAQALELRVMDGRALRVHVDADPTQWPTHLRVRNADGAWDSGPLLIPAGGPVELDAAPSGLLRVSLALSDRLVLVQAARADDDNMLRVPFPAPADAGVRGRIVGPEGAPVPGARIVVVVGAGRRRAPAAWATTTSGPDGRYEVSGLPATELARIVVTAPGFAPFETKPGGASDSLLAHTRLEVNVTLGPAGELSGRVVDVDGTGLAGATVRLWDDRAKVTTTDASGAFSLRDLAQKPHELVCELPGYRPARPDLLEARNPKANAGPDSIPVIITMVRAALIKGVVVDTAGAPVAGCHVEARAASRVRFGTRPAGYGEMTDAEGRFALNDVPAGTAVEVVARAPGLRSAPVPQVRLAAGETGKSVSLILHPALALTGRVLTKDDEPVEGRRIALARGGGFLRPDVSSDAEGRFTIPNLLPGQYTVVMGEGRRFMGNQKAVMRVLAYDAPVDLILFRSDPRSSLSGRVTDPEGRPLSGLSVGVTGVNASSMHVNPGGYFLTGDHGGGDTTDEEGHFRVAGLWGGGLAYTVTIRGMRVPGTYAARDADHVITAPHTNSEMVTYEIVDEEGRARGPGMLRLGFQAEDPDSAWNPWERVGSHTAVFRNGRATVAWPVGADAVDVNVVGLGRASHKFKPLRPMDGRIRVVVARGPRAESITLKSLVLNASGAPVAGAVVELDQHEDTDAWRGAGPGSLFFKDRSQATDASGRARFDDVPEGLARMRVAHAATHRRTDPQEAVEGIETVFTLEPAATLRGQVVDKRGVGVARAVISWSGIPDYESPPQAITDERGHFTLLGLPAGAPVDVQVTPPDDDDPPLFGKRVKEVDPASTEPLRITLESGHWVEGQFAYPDGRAVRGGEAVLQSPEGKQIGHAYLDPDSFGSFFRMGPVRAGRYHLHIQAGVTLSLDAFMQAPVLVRVPGPVLTVPVEATWDLHVQVAGIVPEDGGSGLRWCPDEVTHMYGEDADRPRFSGRGPTGSVSAETGTGYLFGLRERTGYVWVHAVGPGPGGRFALVRVERAREKPLEVVLRPGQRIAGRVASGGRHTLHVIQGVLVREIQTRKDGTFEIQGLPPGTWRIERVGSPGSERESVLGSVDAEAGQTDVVVP